MNVDENEWKYLTFRRMVRRKWEKWFVCSTASYLSYMYICNVQYRNLTYYISTQSKHFFRNNIIWVPVVIFLPLFNWGMGCISTIPGKIVKFVTSLFYKKWKLTYNHIPIKTYSWIHKHDLLIHMGTITKYFIFIHTTKK